MQSGQSFILTRWLGRLAFIGLVALLGAGNARATGNAIAAGGDYSLRSGPDGTLYAWGFNNGTLGDGTGDARTLADFVKLPAGVKVTAIAALSQHALAIGSDGKLYAWGNNNYGQLGDGTTNSAFTPVVVKMPTGISAVALTKSGGLSNFSLVLGSDGKLYAFGDNTYGQLGLGLGLHSPYYVPLPIAFPAGVTITAFASGAQHALALGSDGKVYAWGANESCQLGDPSRQGHDTPIAVSLPTGVNVVSVGAGVGFSVVAGADGKLYAWGFNSDGEVGATVPFCAGPAAVNMPTGVSANAISVGRLSSLLLTSDGKVYGWGKNDYQILGPSSIANSYTPIQIQIPVKVTAISAGAAHVLALGVDGKIYAWGRGDEGQLGNNISTTSTNIPVVSLSLQPQTINFVLPPYQMLGSGSYPLDVVASSGLGVTLNNLTPSTCTISGARIAFNALGTCTLTADQSGDPQWAPAPRATQSFVIKATLANQVIDFSPIHPTLLATGTLSLNITASSSLPVSLTSETSLTCSVSGQTVKLLALGICTITANQMGNINFSAASPISQSFNIASTLNAVPLQADTPLPLWSLLLLGGGLLKLGQRRKKQPL